MAHTEEGRMIGYVYFIQGQGGLLKIGHTHDPRRRYLAHRGQLKKVLGEMNFLGCVEGSMEDERVALESFPSAGIAHRHEIRRGIPLIGVIFKGKKIFGIEDLPTPSYTLKPQVLNCTKCAWLWHQRRASKNLPVRCPNPDCRSKCWRGSKAA